MIETMINWVEGKITPQPQETTEVSYAPKITEEVTLIQWRDEARAIYNRIRGLSPSPAAHTFLHGQRVALHRAALTRFPENGNPGTIYGLTETGVVVNCGKGTIEIRELQLENRKKMSASEFVKGFRRELVFQ
jgi:methionyl-tRNA formyltransferase